MEEYTQYPPPLRPPSQEIVAAEQRNKVVSKLHAILKPFMLRRLKSDVAIGLPRKAEILLYSQVGRKGAAWKGGGGAQRWGRDGRDGREGSGKMPGPRQSRRPSPPWKAPVFHVKPHIYSHNLHVSPSR